VWVKLWLLYANIGQYINIYMWFIYVLFSLFTTGDAYPPWSPTFGTRGHWWNSLQLGTMKHGVLFWEWFGHDTVCLYIYVYMCMYDMSNMYNMYNTYNMYCICHQMPLDQIERPKTEALLGKSMALSSDIWPIAMSGIRRTGMKRCYSPTIGWFVRTILHKYQFFL
jgi:hypothetical protein